MCVKGPVSGAMQLLVRLRRGKIARAATVAVAVPFADARADAAAAVFDAFARFVEASRCDGQRVRIHRATTDAHQDHGVVIETWEALFPRMDPDEFAMLARMVRSSVPGARRLEIREQAPEWTLVVTGFHMDTETTLPDLPWRIAVAAASAPALRLTFAEPVAPEEMETATAALRAWADVLALGGFPEPDGPPGPANKLLGVEWMGERELVAGLEGVGCGSDAWEALFGVLLPVHARTSIEAVEIVGGAP